MEPRFDDCGVGEMGTGQPKGERPPERFLESCATPHNRLSHLGHSRSGCFGRQVLSVTQAPEFLETANGAPHWSWSAPRLEEWVACIPSKLWTGSMQRGLRERTGTEQLTHDEAFLYQLTSHTTMPIHVNKTCCASLHTCTSLPLRAKFGLLWSNVY